MKQLLEGRGINETEVPCDWDSSSSVTILTAGFFIADVNTGFLGFTSSLMSSAMSSSRSPRGSSSSKSAQTFQQSEAVQSDQRMQL